MSETTLELQIRDNAASAVQGLESLISVLGRVQRAVEKGLNIGGATDGVSKFGQAVNAAVSGDTVSRYEKLASALERIQKAGGMKASSAVKQSVGTSGWVDVTDQFFPKGGAASAQIESYKNEVRTLGTEAEKANGALETVSEGVSAVGQAATANSSFLDRLTKQLRNVQKASKSTHGGLGQLFNSFARIAKYRLFRAALRQITEGFRFGLANVREYSKAIGSEFNTAMESANNATFKMKNSLGAALAPVIMSLIPILQQLVSWVIAAANALNQLFAMFRGQSTWTRATDAAASSMDKVAKSAGGASKELKGLLADWDELNIIQSQPGGGGGGGGSASDIDYLSMFEEVDVFDSKIRDLVSWVEDHLYVITGLVAGIAAKLLGLSAGNILISVGLALSWSSGFDMGYNGINPDNVAGAVGGALAASIGGALIGSKFGPVGTAVGAALGFVISVGATVVAYFQGLQKKRWDDLWGELELTAEEIQQYVDSSFNFPINATIETLQSTLTDLRQARNQLNLSGVQLSMATQKVKLGIDNSPAAISDLVTQAQAVVKDANTLLQTSSNSFTVLATLVPMLGQDEEGNPIDISADLVTRFQQMNTEVSQTITGLGEEIARWYDQGMSTEWHNNEDEMVRELTERLLRVTAAVQNGAAYGSMYGQSATLLNGITRDNANAILEQQMALINDYQKAIKDNFSEAIGVAAGNASMAMAMAAEAGTEEERQAWLNKAAEYQSIADEMEALMEETLGATMENAIGPIRERWIEALKNLDLDYGTAMRAAMVNGFAFGWEDWRTEEGMQKDIDKYLAAFFKQTGLNGEHLRGMGLSLLDVIDLDTNGRDVAEFVKWADDTLGEYADAFIQGVTGRSRADIIAALPNFFEDYAEAMREDVRRSPLAGPIVSTLTDMLIDSTDVAASVAVPVTVSATPIIDRESLMTMYQSLEQAMRNFDVSDLIFSTPEQYFDDFISATLRDIVLANGLSEEDAASITDTVKDWFVDSMIGRDGGFDFTIDQMLANIEEMIDRRKIPGLDAGALTDGLTQTANDVETQINRIKNSVASLNGLSFSFMGGLLGGTFNVTLPAMAADGGMFGSGELFIAREAGPELVGQIGSRTTVANNDQIVAGIAGGVAAGQEEQNALLRRQNDLLMRMLNKKFTAEVTPSAKLGRVNRMSEEMYARNTGTGV